jgi:cytochrome P450
MRFWTTRPRCAYSGDAPLIANESQLLSKLMIAAPALAIPHVVTDFTAEDYPERLHEHYDEWRRHTPVFRNQDGVVYLTRHEDCALAISDPRFGRQAVDGAANPIVTAPQETGALHATIANWMLFMDPPRHPAVRRAFGQALSAREARLTDAGLRGLARQLLEVGEAVDFLAGLGGRLPGAVICHLMGVPAADAVELGSWVSQMMIALDSGEEQGMHAAAPAATAMREYFRCFTASDAARGPGGFVRDVVESSTGVTLSEDEIIDGCLFLVVAGHETARNFMAASVLALTQHPEQMRLLREEPGVARSAIEELLRYAGPVQKLSRWTREDVTLGGYTIPRGTLVVSLMGAANRDPAVFADPHKLDLRRSPNPHLAFGRGGHTCLGRPLALREASVALDELLRASSRIEVLAYRWAPNASMRSLAALTLRVEPSGISQ